MQMQQMLSWPKIDADETGKKIGNQIHEEVVVHHLAQELGMDEDCLASEQVDLW